MVDPGAQHGDVADEPVVDWDELWQELDLPVDPFAACSDRSGDPPPDLGEALRAYNPSPSPRIPASEEIWDHWVGVLSQRIAARWHNVVVITGEPGCGKSTLALRLARAVDRGFGPAQVAYSAPDMLGLYRKLGHGQVAVYDEAILGLLSNDFQTPEARELVKAVNIVRAKGITVLLCIPDIHRLLAAWREEAVKFWIHCESDPRGVGWMHQRPSTVRYERRASIGLYKDPEWNPLRWSSLESTEFWAEYERLKLERIDRFMEESMDRLSPGDRRERDRSRRRGALRRLLADGYTEHEARELTGADWEEVKRAYRDWKRRNRG